MAGRARNRLLGRRVVSADLSDARSWNDRESDPVWVENRSRRGHRRLPDIPRSKKCGRDYFGSDHVCKTRTSWFPNVARDSWYDRDTAIDDSSQLPRLSRRHFLCHCHCLGLRWCAEAAEPLQCSWLSECLFESRHSGCSEALAAACDYRAALHWPLRLNLDLHGRRSCGRYARRERRPSQSPSRIDCRFFRNLRRRASRRVARNCVYREHCRH